MRILLAGLAVGLTFAATATAAELQPVSMIKARTVARHVLQKFDDDSDRIYAHRFSYCERRSTYLVRCFGHELWENGDNCLIRVNVTRPGRRYRYDTRALYCR